MERRGFIKYGILVMFLVLFSPSFVSAYFYSARTFTQDIIDTYVSVFEPILQALFGGVGWSGLYLFERFLLFILLMSVVYLVLGKIEIFEKQIVVRWIVALIVPLIGIRFIDFEWLTAVLLSYQAVAIALTTAVPLLVFFFFVYGIGREYPHVRKILWILFLGVYVGLWSTAVNDVGSTAYFWTFLVGLLLLLFDNKIQYYLYLSEQRKANKYWHYDMVSRLQQDITLLQNSGLSQPEKDKAIKRKQKEIERILKENY